MEKAKEHSLESVELKQVIIVKTQRALMSIIDLVSMKF